MAARLSSEPHISWYILRTDMTDRPTDHLATDARHHKPLRFKLILPSKVVRVKGNGLTF